jgi:diguanylate cyclase (GGDEF)-like protein
MPKTMRNEEKKFDTETADILDAGNTVQTSGLFGTVSAYIPVLTFLSGPVLGKEIPLIHREIHLGRGSENDIIIPDPTVSRRHLQICCRKIVKRKQKPVLKVVLRDLGSRNGTRVNYETVHRAVLKPGDKIILGRIILKYDHRDIAEQNFYEEIYRLATTDSLTSLLNKASIMRFMQEEIDRNVRNRRPVSAVLVDIDEFKSMNDLFGHLTGDRIIQRVSESLRSSIRKRDGVGRFGGDEFLMVLPETGLKGAVQLANRLRKNIEASISVELGLSQSVTVSMGVSSGRAHKIDADNLIEWADSALYRAKALGRNRTEAWKAPRIPVKPR